ncbi:VWD domain-containing protein [Nocardioides sp. AE5]|uniref:VWD domain-containing protein n=1 Tax=Nocardioides sp. AE5 TaxID=2962573 RepID=UPI002882D24B|nr:PQQ-binding-like beta-propeller repeat protein [Nocardioides sp. AE5]MDT0203084.1 PQQ-binding-like beta-propeller repeat protein [Nocardioides sp. AE5]
MSRTHRTRGLLALVGMLLLVPLLVACESNPPGDPCASGDGDPPLFATNGPTCEPQPPCPDCGGGWGDPHIVTHDGDRYNLMAVGEFTLASNGETEVQIRTAPMGSSRVASMIDAAAVRHGDTTVSVERGDGAELAVHLNGRARTVTDTLGEGDAVLFWEADDRTLTIALPDEIYVFVDVYGTHLDVWVQMSGETTGLLGDNDGDDTNDRRTRQGEAFPTDASFEDFYGVFAESWRITNEDSAFHYGPGEDTETYTDRTFPDQPISMDMFSAETRAWAEQVCTDAGVQDPFFDDCVLDVAVSEDEDLATSAQTAQEMWLGSGRTVRNRLRPDATGPTSFEPSRALWTAELGPGFPRDVEIIPVHDTLLAVGNNRVVALDPDDGTELWRLEDIAHSCRVAALGPDALVMIAHRESAWSVDKKPSLIVVDRATGEVRSSVVGGNPTYCAPISVHEDTVITLNYHGGNAGWRMGETGLVEAWHEDGNLQHAGVLADGRLVAHDYSDAQAQEVILVDRTGKVGSFPLSAGQEVTQPMVADADLVAVPLRVTGTEEQAAMLGLRVADNTFEQVWQLDVPLTAPNDVPVASGLSLLTVRAGLLVAHHSHALVGIDIATGEVLWAQDGGAFHQANPPLITEDRIYQGDMGGFAYTYPLDGSERVQLGPLGFLGAEATVTRFGPALGENILLHVRARIADGQTDYVVLVPPATTP